MQVGVALLWSPRGIGLALPPQRTALVRSRRQLEVAIRFMLLTYNAPGGKEIWAAMSPAEREAEETEYRGLFQSMRASGVLISAEEVEHHDAAQTVRVREGIVSVLDGPTAPADEYITGYLLIQVDSSEEATGWAARVPNARTGSVEIRPVMDIDW